jgi:hypothetical protein
MGTSYDVKVFMNGTALREGDVITGSDVNDVYVQNGIAKYEPAPASGPEGHLYCWDAAAYTQALDSGRGDGAFFATPNANRPDSIAVVKASRNEAVVAAVWDAWNLNTGYLGTPGVGSRDAVTGALNYPVSSATPKYTTAVKVAKVAVMRRGRDGVYLGFHSDPLVGPGGTLIPTQNNWTDYGEREFQLGIGIQVAFSSAGIVAMHPAWGADATWGTSSGGANYATIRHAWMGLDDANYPPYSDSAYIAAQVANGHVGFPAEQADGPFWIGALHNLNGSTYPFAAYMVLPQRLEFGSFQFSAGGYGQPTLHFANEARNAGNVHRLAMCFIGAFPYTSASLAAEPTASLSTLVASKAAEVTAAWPV